ncbi:MAG: DNA-processing protein DprA [Gammaproteobacteria bacterium]|nr:DNA-processing protein DprA [Gammaproteobacteria bacterium]
MIEMVSPLQLQYLQLTHCDATSRRDLCRLVTRFGSIAGIEAADPKECIEAGITELQWHQLLESLERHSPDNERITRALAWHDEDPQQRHLICFEQPDYPDLLKEIACPPVMLFVAGDVSCLNMPQLAIVGSRRSSNNGEQTAAWIAGELAKSGFCVTSGLAAGIDSFAHSGALADNGKTVGVLGTGIDRVYPQRNRRLAEQVTGSGALVSEFSIGTPPVAGNFPQRNRIIAGLSLGVIVVEATIRSGSLITARLAMESNREVFAIPGSIHSGNSRGCHRLIREGAKLVEDVDAVLEELTGPLLGLFTHSNEVSNPGMVKSPVVANNTRTRVNSDQTRNLSDAADLESSELKLLQLMDFEPCPAELLAIRAGVSIDRISRLLSSLELKGYLQQTAGRYQRLVNELQVNSKFDPD